MIRSRIRKVIQLTFPELEKMFTSKSDLFLNFIQLFPHPDCVLSLSKTIKKIVFVLIPIKRYQILRQRKKHSNT
ncbi:hypothetical protein bcgnr5384_48580 [Bacillus cereus]